MIEKEDLKLMVSGYVAMSARSSVLIASCCFIHWGVSMITVQMGWAVRWTGCAICPGGIMVSVWAKCLKCYWT